MRRRDVIALFLLLATAAQAPGEDDEVGKLIKQLGSREPDKREQAMNELRTLGDAIRPALREAAQSNSPAISDAAMALLMDTRWSRMSDPPEVKAALQNYGKQSPDERADILHSLLQIQPLKARPAVVRVLQQDPSDAVAWQTFEEIVPDPSWVGVLKAVDVKNGSPGLVMFYARALYQAGDVKSALPLLRQILDREADRPSAAAHQLLWAVQTLADVDVKQRHPDRAADRLRTLLARADDQMTSQSDLLNTIFNLQARFGPLPKLSEDVAAAQQDVDGRASLMLGLVAQRIDAPLAHDLLLDAALSDRPNENDIDRSVRLYESGMYLLKAGQFDASEEALTRVTKIDNPAARGNVSNSFLGLSDLYFATRRWQLAGDSLQRALDRLEGGQILTLKNSEGNIETLSKENSQSRVYWLYYKAAKQNNDTAGMKKQADLILASGSTDGSYFLDVLPTLETTTDPVALTAFFDRVYAQQKSELDQAPQSPLKLNDLAWLCGRSNRRLDEANAYAKRALQLKPDEPAYLDTYAEIRFRSGAIREAIALETKAAALDPNEPFMSEQLERFRKAAATQPDR